MTATIGLQLLLDETEPRIKTRADRREYMGLEMALARSKLDAQELTEEEIEHLSRFLGKHGLSLSQLDAFEQLAAALDAAVVDLR